MANCMSSDALYATLSGKKRHDSQRTLPKIFDVGCITEKIYKSVGISGEFFYTIRLAFGYVTTYACSLVEPYRKVFRSNTIVCVPGSLEERIYSQKSFNQLDLSVCDLESIPLEVIISHYEGCPKELDLSFNQITCIDDAFPVTMISLQFLDISRNKLRKLPENFGELRSLRILDLHDNQLQTLPQSMSRLEKLIYLNIYGNKFQGPMKRLLMRTMARQGTPSYGAMAKTVVAFLKETDSQDINDNDMIMNSTL